VFAFPGSFQKDGKAVPSYAFPFYIVGTTFLFMGMLCCAIIIERSSKEYHFKPNKPSKIFWLQPGKQNVGDQVFNAFMAVKEGPQSTMTMKMEYIKSKRVRRYDGRQLEIYITLSSTLLGFIFQFIGLRGLHASVILAQLGSTFVMSILRTCLRTERMPPDENKIRNERELASHKQQELECFAFHLKDAESFEVLGPSLRETALTDSSSGVSQLHLSLVDQLIRTRARLAELTASSSHGLTVGWDNMPIRKVAQDLALVIESTMDLMSTWNVNFGKSFKFRLGIECRFLPVERNSPVRNDYSICLSRCGDALRWHVDTNELEAVLGLWVWSLYKSDESRRQPLNRMVGLTADEASKKGTYLLFHKWVFRQTEARLVSSRMIDSSRRLFGFDADDYSHDNDILIMRTENKLELMAAQDLYINFLQDAFDFFDELGGETDIVTGLQNTFEVHNTRIDEMMHCFERCGLGSREDALLCIVPVLRNKNLLPQFTAYCTNARRNVERLILQNDWETAFDLVRWICQRTEGFEFERSAYQLGYLCRRALLDKSKVAQDEGIENTCRILDSDTETDFFKAQRLSPPARWSVSPEYQQWWAMLAKQVGWVAWRISVNVEGMKRTQPALRTRRVEETLFSPPGIQHLTDTAENGTTIIQNWLTLNYINLESEDDEDEIGYKWAREAGFYGLLYFILVRWIELDSIHPGLIQHAYCVAAKNNCDWGIQVLLQHGTDINTLDGRGESSALTEVVFLGDLEAARTLLNSGANPDGDEQAPDSRPLQVAALRGTTEMVRLLLDRGAELEIEDSVGLTPLHLASQQNRLDTVRILLSRGAEVEKTGLNNFTSLHSAVLGGHLQMTQLLLEGNADINARDGNYGQTPLMLALRDSNVNILRLLLARGADVQLRDNEGLTAWDHARGARRDDIVAILEGINGEHRPRDM
jgi:ankyrin repeat protein